MKKALIILVVLAVIIGAAYLVHQYRAKQKAAQAGASGTTATASKDPAARTPNK